MEAEESGNISDGPQVLVFYACDWTWTRDFLKKMQKATNNKVKIQFGTGGFLPA